MEVKLFTISVYTENTVGLLNRISAIFLKRHINIKSLTTSQSEIEFVNRFVIVAEMTEETVKKIVKQLEKQIEVVRAYYHTDEDIIHQESALYKVKSSSLFDERHIQNIIKDSHANIVTVSREFFVIEKTGRRHETEKLFKDLKPYGLLQFVRSGRIAVTKEAMSVSGILENIYQ
ncbi:MAG: acetolactate synthase small subunit [Flavobacteriales bacterium]|nr:MAG: acetolactate synthase small subunit [Flavobacteriales bacterium]PIE49610.1 MAG: acetolactate synthase small subunit [Flavobacteriales bacterium]